VTRPKNGARLKTRIKTRTWVILILAFLAVCIAAALWLAGRSAPGKIANIYVDGVCVYSVDLTRVTETELYPIEDTLGKNVVCIEPGRICVQAADCPDQVCVEAGWLSDSALPIVCLPHRLVIRLEETGKGQTAFDTVSQ
jgi:hypothetical protein